MINKNNINAVNLVVASSIISAGCMPLLNLGRQIGVYPKTTMSVENSYMFYSSRFFGLISGVIEAGRIGFIIRYLLIKVYKTLENRN